MGRKDGIDDKSAPVREDILAQAGAFAGVLESTFDAIVIHDGERILYANPAAVSLFGAGQASDLAGRLVCEQIHPRSRLEVARRMRELLDGNTPVPVVRESLLRLDGSPFDVELTAVLIEHHGRPAIATIFRDVTESNEYRSALRYVSGLQQLLVEVSHLFVSAGREETRQVIDKALEQIGKYCDVDRVYIFQFKEGQQYFYCASAWCRESISCEVRHIENMSVETVPNIVQSILDFQAVRISQISALKDEWQPEKRTFSGGSIQSLVVVPISNRAKVSGFIGFDAVRYQRDWNEEEIRLLSVLGDLVGAMIERHHIERALHDAELEVTRIARFDSLTNLPNRILVAEKLEQDLIESGQSGSRVAVIFIDLDFFKKANDSLGHRSGDQILIRAAQRLVDVVGKAGMVARFGGDELLVIVRQHGQELVVLPLLHKILECFRQPFNIQDREILLTASIGVSVAPDDANNASALIRNADIAMHKAKQDGRDRYHFYRGEMNDEIERRLEIEHGLRSALGTGEIYPVFQPIFDTDSARVAGVEVLLRWNSPDLGQVSPDEFIPIAEQAGMIHQLGEFVVDSSLSRLASWRRGSNQSMFLAVNASPYQINDPSFCQLIGSKLEQYDIPATALEIEVTEGLVLSALPHVDKTLEGLREIGVRLSLDDFGTGYSSLSYLREFQFDTLKLDRSFVQNCTWHANDGELVHAAIRIARGLGLRMIAEGVESREQVDFLTQHNCQMMQGYYLARPMTEHEVTRFLRDDRVAEKSR